MAHAQEFASIQSSGIAVRLPVVDDQKPMHEWEVTIQGKVRPLQLALVPGRPANSLPQVGLPLITLSPARDPDRLS